MSDTRRAVAVVYDRVAPVYDLYTAPMEALGGRRARQRLFGRARGRVLELGIGTGLSLPSYPPGAELTGIDISPRMLARARRRAHRMGLKANLQVADIEQLPYPYASFGTVTAVCVFWGVVIFGIVMLVRYVRRGGEQTTAPSSSQGPERLLAERFARGEIDEEEYRQRLATLQGAGQATDGQARPAAGTGAR